MELYKPGTYCKAIECAEYNDGKFSSACDGCGAYRYYLWLQKNGFQIVSGLTPLALDGGDSAASEQLSTPEVLSALQGESTPAHRK